MSGLFRVELVVGEKPAREQRMNQTLLLLLSYKLVVVLSLDKCVTLTDIYSPCFTFLSLVGWFIDARG